MQAIQFEAVVSKGIIHIPEQYMKIVPATVNVTILPVVQAKLSESNRKKPLSIDEFPAVLDTKNFKFDREEANER
jgi:hypothetical protein